jgi:hypothetical protein
MKKKSAGRPKKTEGLDLVTLEECVKRAQEFLGLDEPPFGRRRLQNRVSAGEFGRYGTFHEPLIDWNEVKRDLHWRRKVS